MAISAMTEDARPHRGCALVVGLLREDLEQVEADAATYRELLVASFDALQDLTRRYDRLRADRDRWREMYGRLSEDTLIRGGVEV
jgi:hypothetical protein